MLDAGAGLVAKSMIVADDASGTTRYQMLETLRTFARERLEADGRSPRDVPSPRRALHAVRGGGRRRARRTRRGGVAQARPPRVRQPPRRVHPLPDARRGRRRAGARCASSPRSRSKRSTTAAWASAGGPSTSCRRVDLAPPAVRTAGARGGGVQRPGPQRRRRHARAHRRPRCATACRPTARVRCGRTSPSPRTRA